MTEFVGTKKSGGLEYDCYKANGFPSVLSQRACYEGDANNFLGREFIISGRFNRVVGDYVKLTGDYNIVVGSWALVIGDYNIICGEDCKVIGTNNIIFSKKPRCFFHPFSLDAEHIIRRLFECQGVLPPGFLPNVCDIDKEPCRIVFPEENFPEKNRLLEFNWNPPVHVIEELTEKKWTFTPMRIFYLPLMPSRWEMLSSFLDARSKNPSRIAPAPERASLSNASTTVESSSVHNNPSILN